LILCSLHKNIVLELIHGKNLRNGIRDSKKERRREEGDVVFWPLLPKKVTISNTCWDTKQRPML
jgi:hypothetical protein